MEPEFKVPAAHAEVEASDWVVLKFGGSSVATLANWQHIATRIRRRMQQGLRVLVVHSAVRGVSDCLQQAIDAAVADDQGPDANEVRELHLPLSTAFELDVDALLGADLDELRQLLAGVRLIREASPRVAARILAMGELMATRLSAQWLKNTGIDLNWHDARSLLVSSPGGVATPDYLEARCSAEPDGSLAERLELPGVHLTQGFIARHPRGDTVVLGRGGSDTSAAVFAARLRAQRVEIWTDVPGMFSADPRAVPSARLLTQLHYAEAQEIASAGGLVLHPRCIEPVASAGIPMFVRCTSRPDLPGTLIANIDGADEPSVKAIALREGVTLLSLESIGMWHEVGFLARAFTVFAEFGVSIGMISTSESSLTVSLDEVHEAINDTRLQALIAALSELCHVRVVHDCVAVSLVGRKIRTTLHQLGPAFDAFEEQRIHMVSQAANDLNLTVVVDAGQGHRLVRRLHPAIMRHAHRDPGFGPTWESLQMNLAATKTRTQAWWVRSRDLVLDCLGDRQCAYVYDLATIEAAANALQRLRNVDRVFFAMKANAHPDVLASVYAAGLGFECVSPGELDHVLDAFPGIDPGRLLYTPNFAPREDYQAGFDAGAQVTLDNLFVLEHWSDLLADREVFLRVDPGRGRGHHEHVRTAGVHAKFGIPLFELERASELAERAGCRVTGVHAHVGSGITTADSWQQVAEVLAAVAGLFPDVRVLDVGGGLGIPEKSGDPELSLETLDASLATIRADHPQYAIWLEPGRFLVAQAGVLLARVTQTKGKGQVRYVGVATGMNSLLRPALYGAYHEIVNLTRADVPASELVNVVGPICESGDILGIERLLPPCEAGDVLGIGNAGAYGRVMSSNYNLRQPAEELTLRASAG